MGELGFEAVRDSLRQTPGTQVKLEVRKDDTLRQVKFELELIL